MWSMELVQRLGTAINRLVFDTKEEAEAQYNKIKPVIGKERDYGKNAQNDAVELVDKFGFLTVVPWEIATVRIFDMDGWSEMIKEQSKKQKAEDEAKELI